MEMQVECKQAKVACHHVSSWRISHKSGECRSKSLDSYFVGSDGGVGGGKGVPPQVPTGGGRDLRITMKSGNIGTSLIDTIDWSQKWYFVHVRPCITRAPP